MKRDEVIHLQALPDDIFHQMAFKALKYGLISIAFTYNRMAKHDIKSRVSNVIKGKIAEAVFYQYNEDNGIKLDYQKCTTPFWLPDVRDFYFLGGEWDIKNNFVHCSTKQWNEIDHLKLPALVPDKSPNDQWSKRNLLMIEDTRFAAYLFTFMRLERAQRDFFSIQLTDDQWQKVSDIAYKYQNYRRGEMPFVEDLFYQKINLEHSLDKGIKIIYQPEMMITGCANARYWSLFKQSNGGSTFCGGLLKTIITNQVVEIGKLPSWSQIMQIYQSKKN